MKKTIAIFFLIFLIVGKTFATKKDIYPYWKFNADFQYGFILKHREIITHLTYQHITSWSLNIERPYVIGVKRFGISLTNINYRNSYIGTEYGVIPYYKINIYENYNALNRTNKRKKIGLRVGVGLGYFTKTFDRISNYKNLLISTHLNGIIQGKIYYEDEVFNLGILFTHASNGAFKMPNYGVNLISVSGGIILPNTIKAKKYWQMDSINKINQEGFIFELGNALKESNPSGGKKYWVNSLSILRYKQLSKSIALTGGLDFIYNRALLNEQKKETWRTNFPDIKQLGLNLGTDITLGKVNATIQYGYNIYMPYKFEGRTYSKLGLKYRITNQFSTGIRLKANGGKADFVEWTMHYKI